MPVPGNGLECKMLICGKVAFNRTDQHDEQHSCTHGYVEPVEPRQHEEGTTVYSRAHG